MKEASLMAKIPRRLKSEQQVLDLLNIPDFRHMTKAKTVEFISAIPQMDREVAMQAISQFPEYTKMAKEVASEYKEILGRALDSNDESVKAQYEVINTVISVLGDISKDEDLTADQKLQIADKLAEMPRYGEKIDKNNKNFLLRVAAVAGSVLGGIVVGGIAILGASGKIDLPELDD